MRTKKVPGLEIKVPSGNAFAFNTDPMMFKSHQSCLVIGKRGSGKSVIAVNIIERMKYDRLFIVSPTIQSNKALLDRLKIDPDDIYDPDDLEALDDIKRKIDEERDLYEKYLADMKKYKEFMKKLKDNPIFRIPDEVLLMFYQNGTFQKPRHKWGGRRPHMAVSDARGRGGIEGAGVFMYVPLVGFDGFQKYKYNHKYAPSTTSS